MKMTPQCTSEYKIIVQSAAKTKPSYIVQLYEPLMEKPNIQEI